MRDRTSRNARRAISRATAFMHFESLENRTLFSDVTSVLPGVPLTAAELNSLHVEQVTTATGTEYAYDGQFVLKTKRATAPAAQQVAVAQAQLDASVSITALEASLGGQIQVVRRLGDDGLYLLHAPTAATLDQLKTAVSSIPGYDYIEPNSLLWTERTPNDPSYSLQYGLTNIGAPTAWSTTVGGNSDLVVAVIDTGIDYTHPDLAGNMWHNPGEIPGDGVDNDGNGYVDDYYGYNFAGVRNSNPLDDNQHGTHVAGIIAGKGNNGVGISGVNWNAKLMALKFLNSGGNGSLADATEAINYMASMLERGVKVLVANNSWGGGGFDQTLKNAIDRYNTAGGLFVAAAGNNGSNSVFYPAGYDSTNIISVASSDESDNRSSFSNYGSSWVDLAAPGSNIYSTLPNSSYGYLSGTSMATPFVTGAAALMWDLAGTGTTRATIQNALLNNVDVLGQWNGLVGTSGRLNVARSLAALDIPWSVTTTSPDSGQLLTNALTDFTVDFSNQYRANSVDASDFKLNGIPADSFTLVDADTIRFSFMASPMTQSGTQTMTIAAGAIARNSDARGLNAFSRTFLYDAIQLGVVASNPASGSTVAIPVTSIEVQYNEPIDPASVQPTDLILNTGTVTAATVIAPNTVRFSLSGVNDESIHNLNALISADAIKDMYGFTGGTPWVAAFTIDSGVVPLNASDAQGPAGSMIYRSPLLSGAINPPGDTDTFSMNIDAGQTLTILVDPASTLHPSIEVFDEAGDSIAYTSPDNVGQDALLQTMAITTEGTYLIVLGGENGTIGSYTVQATLNATEEEAGHDLPANQPASAAQSIDSGFITLTGNGSRAAVTGTLQSGGSSIPVKVYEENFEAPLGASWSTYSSYPQGRVRVSNQFGGYLSNGALLMDRYPAGQFNLNEAVWTVNLAGVGHPVLRFAQGNLGDEQHTIPVSFIGHSNGDGVSVSADGNTWYRVYTTPSTQTLGSWDAATVDLSAVAQQAGISLGTNFKIKFQQYDNLSLPADGRGWDAISITGDSAPEDWYSFTATAGQSVTVGLDTDSNNPDLKLDLYDTSGTLLSSGGVTGGELDQVIENLSLASTGVYRARISGNIATAQDYRLLVTRNSTINIEANDSIPGAQDIGPNGIVVGGISAGDVSDYYRFNVKAGDVLSLRTFTPADGAGQFDNLIDPEIELYSPTGQLLATDLGSAPDGINALLTRTASVAGIYTVRVFSESDAGTYVLKVSGNTGGPIPFAVSQSNPASGVVLPATVSQVTVDFTGGVLMSSVQPGDLTINGQPAASVSQVDRDTLLFTLSAPLGQGSYSMSIAAGAIKNLQGLNLQAFNSSFAVDLTPPAVAHSSISNGQFFDIGTLAYTAQFDEAMVAANITPASFSLTGVGRAVDYTPASYSYNPATFTLTINYTNLPEDAYRLTLKSGDTAFKNHAGWHLDGDANGMPGGDYVVDFGLEPVNSAFPTPLVSTRPLGSLIYTGTQAGKVDFAGDTDEMTLALDAGQTLSLVMHATAASLQPSILVKNPAGTMIGSATGTAEAAALLQNVSISTTGIYTIIASGSGGSTGTYSVAATLNATVEAETYNGADNDTRATAQEIDNSIFSLNASANRLGLTGRLTVGNSDWYAMSVVAGNQLSVAVAGEVPTPLQVEVYDATSLLTQGTSGMTNLDAAVQNFTPSSAGTYYVRVFSPTLSAPVNYSLIVTRNANIDVEANDTATTAQDIGKWGNVLGSLSDSDVADEFKVTVVTGNVLKINTATPGDANGQFVNTLDPALELYDPTGTKVAFNNDGSADSRNASLSHTALASGIYTVRVLRQASDGEYLLSVSGQAGGVLPLTVTGITPVDGEILRVAPSIITVGFSHALLQSSVESGDLLINGQPASGFSFVDAATVAFTVPASLPAGAYTVTMPSGAVANLDGTLLNAFSSSFTLDLTPPIVVFSNVTSGQYLGTGNLTLNVQFDEAINATNLDTTDFSLQGLGLGISYVPSGFSYISATNTFTVSYASLPEDAYRLTLKSGPSQFQNLAGWNLDGDANGTEGGDYVLNFNMEPINVPFPTPLNPVAPAGSMIYSKSLNGKIDYVGDTDEFTIALDGNQTLSVLLSATGTLQPSVLVKNSAGTVLGTANGSAGGKANLQTVTITTAGTYTIVASGLVGSTGSYSLTAMLNAAFETEEQGGGNNDSTATSQNLGNAFTSLGGTSSRAAVVGKAGVATTDRFAVYSDSFENAFGSGWTFKSSATNGRISRNVTYKPTGQKASMTMDVSPANGKFVLNEATWAVNLTGLNQPRLRFQHANLGDEQQLLPQRFTGSVNGDGVAISADGTNWYTVFSPPIETIGVWKQYDFDLAALAQAAGFPMGANFMVKFAQYDKLSIPSDGRGWDDIQITAAGTSDYYQFTGNAGDTVTLGLSGFASGIFDVKLFNSANTQIASASQLTGGELDSILENFSLPSTGTYYVRVSASLATAENYSLVVVKNGTFNIEPQPTTQALPASGLALGSIGISGDTDIYTVNLTAGTLYTFTSNTPGDGVGEFVNSVDPMLELLDGSGNVLASNDNGSTDGHNAVMSYTAPSTGNYRVRISAVSGQGEYIVKASGGVFIGSAQRMVVSGTQAVLPSSPATIGLSQSILSDKKKSLADDIFGAVPIMTV